MALVLAKVTRGLIEERGVFWYTVNFELTDGGFEKLKGKCIKLSDVCS